MGGLSIVCRGKDHLGHLVINQYSIKPLVHKRHITSKTETLSPRSIHYALLTNRSLTYYEASFQGLANIRDVLSLGQPGPTYFLLRDEMDILGHQELSQRLVKGIAFVYFYSLQKVLLSNIQILQFFTKGGVILEILIVSLAPPFWEWPTWSQWVKRGHLPAALGQVLWALSSPFGYLPWEEIGVFLCLRWAVPVDMLSLCLTRILKVQVDISFGHINYYRNLMPTSCSICCKKYSTHRLNVT